MGRAAKHPGAAGIVMICLALCACTVRLPSTAAATPTPTPQPLTSCVAQTPVSAQSLSTSGLQTTVKVSGNPFAAVATADGQWIFVSVDMQSASATPGIAVLRRTGATATSAAFIPLTQFPAGEALTHDGRYLLVADYNAVAVVDVSKAEEGRADAVVDKIPTSGTATTVEVAVSPDDHFVFATDEHEATVPERGDMIVINLQQALAGNHAASGVVGTVPLDYYPVGVALAPNGRDLYVTSEQLDPGYTTSGVDTKQMTGSLTVVDIQRAERDPQHAVVARVAAGCHPVRVVLSSGGDVAWVTARESNAVLAFSTANLASDPAHALLATVPVGVAPVGMALVQQGAELLVACSDRFASGAAPQVAMLLSTQAALQGKRVVQGIIQEGIFPREITLAGTTALVTNYGSQTVNLIDTTRLPHPA